MTTYFEARAKFIRVDGDGRERKVSESFLFDAVSFTNTEARVIAELEKIIKGEFSIEKITKSKIIEVFPDGEYWYKATVQLYDIIDGKEKKINNYFLVSADNTESAVAKLNKGLEYVLVPYKIKSIALSPIVEVYPYFEGNE